MRAADQAVPVVRNPLCILGLSSERHESMPKKKAENLPPKLTDPERDLLEQIEHGYQLETDSLGSSPVQRRLKDDEVLRPADANATTVKALERQGLIRARKGRNPLTLVWHLTKKR